MRPFLSLVLMALPLLTACGEQGATTPSAGPASSSSPFNPNDPEFKKRVQARLEEMKKEEAIREEAPWFGRTGLAEEQERELPRYLRREFGTLLSQPGALKARDLVYLGVFSEGVETVHYWRIDHGPPGPWFAYVVSAPDDRAVMGWGDRRPPR